MIQRVRHHLHLDHFYAPMVDTFALTGMSDSEINLILPTLFTCSDYFDYHSSPSILRVTTLLFIYKLSAQYPHIVIHLI